MKGKKLLHALLAISVLLAIPGLRIFFRTLLPGWWLLLAMFVVGLTAIPLMHKPLANHLNIHTKFWQGVYNVFTLGGLTVSGFLIMNFFFRGEDIRFVREPIVSYGSYMESERGQKGTPTGRQTERFFVTIELEGRTLWLPPRAVGKSNSYVDLAISRGLFGVDVIIEFI